MPRMIEIEDNITVGTLADKLMLPVSRIITELMKNGVMATVNERVDFDTAQIITSGLGLDVELSKRTQSTTVERHKKAATGSDVRPPVVAVMGHVDHGKTSLLDAIRTASVVKGEAGGITQHISAYQITHNKRPITFLDTPGHEAFAALREHGAQLTDLVVIVVAADDGVKPQTLEAIRFAQKAGVKMVVAMNKMDKPEADPNRLKQQLSDNGLLVEDWGGDTVAIPVSAKTKEGIPQLLDMLLLMADLEDLRADTKGAAAGLIIEAHMEQGRGPVAEALVEQGTLCRGDFVVAGGTYAKVRNLELTSKKSLEKATPSTPVVITGFKALPEFGDEFIVVKSEKEARLQAEKNAGQKATAHRNNLNSSELMRLINRSHEMHEFNILVKADVQGSLTSVIDSLRTMDTEEVAVRVVGSGVGTITENDIHMASTSGAVIYGFNVAMPSGIKQLAIRDKVSIRLYKVIYELIDDVRAQLSDLLAPEVIETELGRLVVRGVFKTTRTEVICGGEVTKGKLTIPAQVRVIRDGNTVAEVEAHKLQRGPQEAKEIVEGEMCGVNLRTSSRVDIQEGDRLEFFTRETVARTL